MPASNHINLFGLVGVVLWMWLVFGGVYVGVICCALTVTLALGPINYINNLDFSIVGLCLSLVFGDVGIEIAV